MCLKDIEWEGVDWIDLAQAMNKWRAVVNTVTTLWVSVDAWNFFVG
jgi:hypothetical protein